ncbi:hypothetical protein [Paraburkholderia sediminicola]|uniref:hypothetical protein n=1 Tax=Paraburkholderia sediminicola TaxID=458836 RepID=UPI0038B7F4E8
MPALSGKEVSQVEINYLFNRSIQNSYIEEVFLVGAVSDDVFGSRLTVPHEGRRLFTVAMVSTHREQWRDANKCRYVCVDAVRA